ncbi:MAG TPA: hypothetical protein VHW09_13680 [Bryobacteraceae bacterium]|jgi:hypothetical protein|nr:hypothetical protein [Bryobacteraceae bacterium]
MVRPTDAERRSAVPHLIALTLLSCFALSAQTAPDHDAILARLDRLEQENRAMAEEIHALRAELAAAQAAPATPAAETLAEKVDIQDQRIEEQAQTKVESSQKFPISLTGMALVNAFVNSKQNGGSDYPTAASFNSGADRGGATVRQTTIGLEYHGPQTFLGGTVHGAIFMDFYQGAAPLQEWIRLRTATVELDWKTRSVKFGVDKPIFSPRDPDSLAQVGVSPLTGAGNLWLWMPQLRLEQDFALGSSSGVNAQIGAVETHETNPYSTTTPSVKIETVRPGLEGRVNAWHKLDDTRRIEVAAGFHTSTTHAGGFSIPSNLVSLDWFFNPWRRVEFSGAFFSGQNVSNLGTGAINQGYYIYYNTAEAVGSKGGWGQFTIHTLPRLDFHLFTGQQAYSIEDRQASVSRNLLFGGNLYFRLAPNVLFGPEITQTRTFYLGQGLRINNHYDMALAYLF